MRAEETEDARLFLAETGIPTDSVVFGRFFDISLCSGEEEIQPEGRSVTVEILLPEGVDVQVVHFTREPEDASPSRPMLTASADGLQSMASAVAEDEPFDGADTGDVVRGVEVEGDAVLFTATGFSAYAIVEGPEVLPLGWTRVSSLEEMIEKGRGGLYIGNPEGFYFTNSLIIDTDSKKRTGIAKTTPARSYPASDAALYWFEQAGESNNQVYIWRSCPS